MGLIPGPSKGAYPVADDLGRGGRIGVLEGPALGQQAPRLAGLSASPSHKQGGQLKL